MRGARWPLTAHGFRATRTHRIATAASLLIGRDTLRVYSTHLGTMADIRGSSRREPLLAILDDAKDYRRVVVGGDLNQSDIGDVATKTGYLWPTEKGPRTTSLGRWITSSAKVLLLVTASQPARWRMCAVRAITDQCGSSPSSTGHPEWGVCQPRVVALVGQSGAPEIETGVLLLSLAVNSDRDAVGIGLL